jgi:flavin-dependent dehydrogenase
MPQIPSKTDVLIIGAGPSGSVAGATLARAGHSVLCVEKQWFPRHTIGESLLPRCLELLDQAGLLEAVKKRNYMVKHAATFLEGGKTQRFAFKDSLPGDWVFAYEVPRDDFDQTLAGAARAQGVDLRFGHEVESLAFDDAGATVHLKDLEGGSTREVRARFVLDCSGPARVLSKALALEEPVDILARSAYYTHVEGDLRPAGEEEGDIWVVVHPTGAWIWIIPFSNGRTSVGVVAEQSVFDAAEGATEHDKLWNLLKADPNCARRLARAVPVMKTQRLHAWTTVTRQLHGPCWAVAGNAGDFLDPVFSSGVMFALESGTLAAQLASRQLKGEAVDWERGYQDHMHKAIAVFRGFVKAWYTGDLARIFFSPFKPMSHVRNICSILGGNVLNEQNPLVTRGADHGIQLMLKGIEMLEGSKSKSVMP